MKGAAVIAARPTSGTIESATLNQTPSQAEFGLEGGFILSKEPR